MEKVAIKYLAKIIQTGKTPPTKIKEYFSGEIDWYTPTDLGSGKYLYASNRKISKKAIADKKGYLLPKNCLFVSCIGIIGKVGISTTEASSNQQITAIFPNERADINYLYYWFLKNQAMLASLSNNAVVPILNNKRLGDIQIPLPPLPVQQRIATILDAADVHRQKTQALIDKYDELAQSVFLEMFGDPVRNEKGWEVIKLSKLIKSLDTGVSVNSTDLPYSNDKIGILKTSCVYTGSFRPEEAKVIRPDEYDRVKLNPKKDSIIISRMNTNELVGKSAYIPKDYPHLYLPDRLWQTSKSEIEHNVKWLSVAISFKSFKDKVTQIASGTSGSMKNISKKNFLTLPIIYPPFELQNKYADITHKIDIQKNILNKTLSNSNTLFQSLLQRAFRGELATEEEEVVE